MKRMTLIAAALCLVMITTIGAGVVTAKQEANPRQAGASSVYFYDVAATDTHGSGKLMINLDEHKFVFNGKGFDPNKLYLLRARTASRDLHVFASAVATPSGNLHVEGTWITDSATLPPTAAGFGVSAVGSSGTYTGTFTGEGTDDWGGHYYVFVTSDGTFRVYTDLTGLVKGQATATVYAIRMSADHSVVVFSADFVVITADNQVVQFSGDMKSA